MVLSFSAKCSALYCKLNMAMRDMVTGTCADGTDVTSFAQGFMNADKLREQVLPNCFPHSRTPALEVAVSSLNDLTFLF